MLSVQHAPTFLRSPSSGLLPADPATFSTFMQAMGSRYAGKVKAYELWNEENLARETGVGNVDPTTYLPLLKAGYRGIKAGDPNAVALLGALSPTGANITGQSMDDLSYLQQLYALNGGEVKSYFDVLVGASERVLESAGLHAGHAPVQPVRRLEQRSELLRLHRVAQYRDVMTQDGESAKKIWLTEFGYCSNTVAAAGLRVLHVDLRPEPGRLPGPGASDGARTRLHRRHDGLEPQLPAGRAADRREVGLRRDS